MEGWRGRGSSVKGEGRRANREEHARQRMAPLRVTVWALAVIHQAMMGDAMMDKGKGNGEANGLPSRPRSRGSLGREELGRVVLRGRIGTTITTRTTTNTGHWGVEGEGMDGRGKRDEKREER